MHTNFPCLDANKRYVSFPCSQCTAPICWTGKKPLPPPRPLQEGEQYCRREECKQPFRPARTRSRYCTETCRYQAMMKRRRARRLSQCYT